MADIIKRAGKSATWLEAIEIMRDRGNMLSNAQFDELLRKQSFSGYFTGRWWWTSNVLVYPESGGVIFSKRDVKDSELDSSGREWVLPASSVPEYACNVKGVGLLITPGEVHKYSQKIVIEADVSKVIVLFGIPQVDSGVGKADPSTRMPIRVAPEEEAMLKEEEKRWLIRKPSPGVRPVVRYLGMTHEWRKIGVGTSWDSILCIAGLGVNEFPDSGKNALLRLKRNMMQNKC